MMPSEEVPLYASYGGKLSHEQCVENRNRLLKQMDALSIAARAVSGDQVIYDGLRKRFHALKKQKKLYEKHGWSIFSDRNSDQFKSEPNNEPDPNLNLLSPHHFHSPDRSGSQPRFPTPVRTEDVPSLPDEFKKDLQQQHSDEEKCETLEQVINSRDKCNHQSNHHHDHSPHPSPHPNHHNPQSHNTNNILPVHPPHYKSSPRHPSPRPHHKIQHSPPANGQYSMNRSSPPNTSKSHGDSRPYIVADEPPPGPNPTAVVPVESSKWGKKSDAQDTRIAFLLFTKWPYPIPVHKLYQEYQTHYNLPLELTDEAILCCPFIERHTNPFSAKYNSHHSSNAPDFWALKDPLEFLSSHTVKKQYELIREKMHQTMEALHPDGIKETELQRIFKYSIGVELTKLDPQLKADILERMFDRIGDKKGDDSTMHLVMKSRNPPRFPLTAPWKSYALSPKHMLVCILSGSDDANTGMAAFTREMLTSEWIKYFGVALQLDSWYIHQHLEKLIDEERFNNGEFVLSQSAKQKNKDWIDWWHKNGPNASVVPIRNAEPHPSDHSPNGHYQQRSHPSKSPHVPRRDHQYSSHPQQTSNGYQVPPAPAPQYSNGQHHHYRQDQHGTDEHKESYNAVVKYGQNQHQHFHGPQNEDDQKRYEKPREYRDYSPAYRGDRSRGNGWSHDEACLLFVGGIPHAVEDPTALLQIIESQYQIQFANHKPARLRKKDCWGFISPIPVATAEQAQKLIQLAKLKINVESLNIPDTKIAEISVRQYHCRPPPGGNGGAYQGGYRAQGGGGGGQYRPYSTGVYGSRGGGYGAENRDRNSYGYSNERPKNYAEFKAQGGGGQVELDQFGRDNSW